MNRQYPIGGHMVTRRELLKLSGIGARAELASLALYRCGGVGTSTGSPHPNRLYKIERYRSRGHPDPGGTVLSITTSEATAGSRGFSDQNAACVEPVGTPIQTCSSWS